jgi:DNA-binding SARP family transcriptional activator
MTEEDDAGLAFRLLGDIEVRRDGRQVPVGYPQLRCLLAVLLIEANRTVPVDDLVHRVWGNRKLPVRPRSAVQHSIAMLRKALAGAGGVAISRRSNGYHLTVDPRAVDVHRFHELVEQARATADDTRAAAIFEQALGLWHGEPFAVLDTPWINTTRTALVGQQHAARLDLNDIQLRRGRHVALLGELSTLATQHYLDERIAGQYMLALYRSGHQARALRHYQAIRERLANGLGTDPSPPLRRLHHQILRADPQLAPPASAGARTARPVPRQLPARPASFTGRAEELLQLTEAARGPASVVAIGGTGGVGKTWLALHWAHQHLDQFPDGQLYVNLRGFAPSGEPMPPGTALRGLLDALGAEPAALPADLDALASLYRSMVAGRRLLVMLDNAADVDQVVPLLPAGPGCTVLVTSRTRLVGLVAMHGAATLHLDVLPTEDARDLLARRIGQDRDGQHRMTAEPAAVDELLALCGGLPLALGVVAARATTHPRHSLARLAAELREAPLDALDALDMTANVRAVLSWSARGLDEETARVFRLLSVAPGPDIGLAAATALTALPEARTRAVLRRLEHAHLLQDHAQDRYRMHDLIRLFGAETAKGDASVTGALRTLVEFLLHTAYAGDRLCYPHRLAIDPGPAKVSPAVLPDRAAAQQWFLAEHASLLAAQQVAAEYGWHQQVWQLAWVLDTFHRRRGYLRDQLTVWGVALSSAEHLADDVALGTPTGLSATPTPTSATTTPPARTSNLP